MTGSQDGSTAEQILAVLADGRANPLHLREQTGARKQRINKALNRLQAQGRVQKVTRGLYELADDEEFSPPHATLDSESDETDVGEVVETLVEAIEESDRDAFGRVDPAELEFDTQAEPTEYEDGECPRCGTWTLEQLNDGYSCRECEAWFDDTEEVGDRE